MQTIDWQCHDFSALSVEQLYAILQARSEVFVVEQTCVYLDIDGADPSCRHLIAWTTDQQVAAYLRIVPPGLKFAEASIGRVLTTQLGRGSGIGKELIARGLAACQAAFPGNDIRIGAQQYLEKFYQSFGFVTVSEMYLEDDIPHIEMLFSPKQS
ncbi:GNAT family N-acetyltransferase [Undibacterium fentianense]|uniref:GNAT family N-acetyltransferase n=1 Tax=Undibacterium fentianense TaxID=2828728 RepID=A0A941E0W2_9BURK|nr:GNAT family N-acetyltransferase [Undibacterium fentianense]MBR7799311.1 GNAT family N-acetyltransferase [Undibacterium fentianense]